MRNAVKEVRRKRVGSLEKSPILLSRQVRPIKMKAMRKLGTMMNPFHLKTRARRRTTKTFLRPRSRRYWTRRQRSRRKYNFRIFKLRGS